MDNRAMYVFIAYVNANTIKHFLKILSMAYESFCIDCSYLVGYTLMTCSLYALLSINLRDMKC